VYVKPQGESSFTRYAPSELIGVRTGAEVRFEGVVTDADGDPVANRSVDIYNSLQYAPDEGNDGMRAVTTGSDGTFTYPSSGGGVSTASLSASVRPFWFKATGNAAVPFVLYLDTEKDFVDEAEQRLSAATEEAENIKSIEVDTSPASSFADLSVSAQSYPADDTNLSSTSNDAFFRHYAMTYGGPADEPFLATNGGSTTGWLTRGRELYQERFEEVIDDLPERARNYEPTAISTPPVVDPGGGLPSTVSTSDKLVIAGEFLVCGVSAGAAVGSGGIGSGAAVAGCKPLAMTLFTEGASLVCDSFAKKIEQEENRNYNLAKCGAIEVLGVVGSAASFIGSKSVELVELVAGGIETIVPRLVAMTEWVKEQGQPDDAIIDLDGASADFFQDDAGNYKGASLQDVEIISPPSGASSKATTSSTVSGDASSSNVSKVEIYLTRPNRPALDIDSEVDDPENPSALNISVEASRPLYQPSTTNETSPTLRIGDELFSLERTDTDDGLARVYQTQILVSQLPGFGGDGPQSLTASITTAGTTFETVQGEAEGAFGGAEARTLDILDAQSNPSGAVNTAAAQPQASAQDALATLDIPEIAFGGEIVFVDMGAASYGALDNPEQPALRTRSVVARIDASGYAFSKPATLQIAMDQTGGDVESEKIGVYRRSHDGRWRRIENATVDLSTATATATIDSTGFYAVLDSTTSEV
jgi:hypothetical protein